MKTNRSQQCGHIVIVSYGYDYTSKNSESKIAQMYLDPMLKSAHYLFFGDAKDVSLCEACVCWILETGFIAITLSSAIHKYLPSALNFHLPYAWGISNGHDALAFIVVRLSLG